MTTKPALFTVTVIALTLGWTLTSTAGTAEQCEAAKLKASGNKAECLLDAEADSVKDGEPPKTAKCVANFEAAFAAAEDSYGLDCPTLDDVNDIEALVDFCRDEVAAALSGSGEPPPACPQFPATGQTTCWNSEGVVISCDGTGHDGDIRAGATLSYTVNGNIVHDNNTNLDWEMKTDANVGDTYTWSQAFGYIASLNTAPCFAGHCDWRLPNVKELQSIVDYGQSNPSIHPSFGPTAASFYWSSTTFASITSGALSVNFRSAVVSAFDKDSNLHVRAVRGGSP